MRTSRFKPQEVLGLLREAERGVPVREICIRVGVNEATFYRWKHDYGGLEAKGIHRLRELERENSTLRRVVGLRDLEISVLKAELRKAQNLELRRAV
jgi:putative transposase